MLKINDKITVWDKPKNSKDFNSGIDGTIIDIIKGGNLSKPHYKVQLESGQVKHWVTVNYISKI